MDVKTMNSSEKLIAFLEKTKLSKKQLANMIGTSYSYSYNLTDPKIPFPKKKSTLERLAVVMGIEPEELEEYRDMNYNTWNMKYSARDEFMELRKMSSNTNLQIIQWVPEEQQCQVVDILRGDENLPPDITLITTLLDSLNDDKQVFNHNNKNKVILLEAAMRDAFEIVGVSMNKMNINMVKEMVEYYIYLPKKG